VKNVCSAKKKWTKMDALFKNKEEISVLCNFVQEFRVLT